MASKMRRRMALLLTAGLATASLAACGSDSESNSTTVTIWSSLDAPVQEGLLKAVEEKAKADGITIDWQTVKDINTLIMQKIAANDTPDIAFIPQPGVVKDIVARGKAFPIDDAIGDAKDTYIPGTLETGQVDGDTYGMIVSTNVKGLVFYPKDAWDQAGYQAPTTIDELNTLTEQIKSDGTAPWCMGIESGPATGWPATDWIETLVGKYGGPEQYNEWVSHEIPFDSDLVREAAGEMETLVLTDGNVYGGVKSIPSTNFATAGNVMFNKKPGCYLYMQGSFMLGTGLFPDDVVADPDSHVGVFAFPPVTAGDNPVLGGGDLAVMMNDSDNVKKVMGYLAESDIGKYAAGTSSFLSPHTDFDTSLYANETTKSIATILSEASAYTFDGSDQMPGAVGSGTFWSEMTAWISGSQDLDTSLKNIDASWPTS